MAHGGGDGGAHAAAAGAVGAAGCLDCRPGPSRVGSIQVRALQGVTLGNPTLGAGGSERKRERRATARRRGTRAMRAGG